MKLKSSRLKNFALCVLFLLVVSAAGCHSIKTELPEPETAESLTITDFTPKSGIPGTEVTITGTGFGNEISAINIMAGNSNSVKPTSVSNHTIVFNIPSNATTGQISVSMLAGQSTFTKNNFTVTADNTDYSTFNAIKYVSSGTFLSQRDNFAAAGAGDKILFAGGGTSGSVFSIDVDIFDITTGYITLTQISEARAGIAAAGAGNKILFAGGVNQTGYSKKVDIYDVVTASWSTSQLSVARTGMAVAASGNKIIFAGGYNGAAVKTVDIYDVVTNSWTTAQLSSARQYPIGAAAGGKVLIAGGTDNQNTGGKVVDIYDVANNLWTTSQLSVSRNNDSFGTHTGAGAGTGNKIVFSGGSNGSKVMDIYTVSTNSWSTLTTDDESYGTAAAAGTKIAFSMNQRKLRVYDVVTNTVTNVTNSDAANYTAAAATKNVMLFGGGTSRTFDFYTLSKQ